MKIASVVEARINAFFTHPRPNRLRDDNWSEKSTDSQNDFAGIKCGARDRRTCVVTRHPSFGRSYHILPLAIWGENATSRWALVDLFHTPTSTQLLRTLMLGDRSTNCNIRKALWLTGDTKHYLYSGRLSFVPVVSGIPYDAATVTEVWFGRHFPATCADIPCSTPPASSSPVVPAVLYCPLGPSLLTARHVPGCCAPGTSSLCARPTLSCFPCLIRSCFNCTPCSLVSVGRVSLPGF